jgi:hypothetical protein
MDSRTSRFDAVIALVASAIVVAASLYFVNPPYAARVDALLAPFLGLLP